MSIDLLNEIGGRPLSSVMQDPPPPFLFENCFRDRSITTIVAPPHRGKTLLMLDMAICLDLEIPLFGRFKPLRGHEVFFLGCDAPAWDYGLQARKLCLGHGLGSSERDLLSINGVWRRGLKITDPETQHWLKAWRAETGASVLFIDTHRATHRANENDSTEMERVWDLLCQMRDSGWCIIMSHHTGHVKEVMDTDVNAGRGSTVIGASTDFMYTLNKFNRKDPRVRVECVKGRGSAGEDDSLDSFSIEYEPSDELVNGKVLYKIHLKAPEPDIDKQILNALTYGPKSRKAILESLSIKGMNSDAAYKYLDNRLQDLRASGKVKIISHGLWGLA